MAQAVFTLGDMVEQVYRGRKPRASPLWQCLSHHFDEFLECGDLARGFARIRCCRVAHECLPKFLRTSLGPPRRRPRHRHGH
jgi:hypothetical protein